MGLAPLSRISWPRTSLVIRWLRLCLPAQGVQIFTGRGAKIPCALQSKNQNINCNKFNTFKIGPYQKSLEKKSIDLICEGLYINGSSVLLHWSTSPLASTVCVCSIRSNSATPGTIARQALLSMEFSVTRLLEWVAISFFSESSQPKDWTHIFCIGKWVLYQLSHQGSPRSLRGTIIHVSIALDFSLSLTLHTHSIK